MKSLRDTERAMSQQNVASNRQAVEAGNRGDLDGWLAHFDPEIVWHGLADEPDPGPFRGHQGLSALHARWRDLLPDLRLDVKEYIDAGEYVIVAGRFHGHTADSEAEVVNDEVFVNKCRDGKIVEVREFRTREEALEAVGLSEKNAQAGS
jgi:ketosteroid isomerase-like protein